MLRQQKELLISRSEFMKNEREPMIVKIPRTIVFGARGFIGQQLIRELNNSMILPVTRLNKNRPPKDQKGRNWLVADLLNPPSIGKILTPGCTVINLVYSGSSSSEDNISMAENLIRACYQAKVSRLIHCSTAFVVGENPTFIVNENTKCIPVTTYERTKYQIEQLLLETVNNELKIYILRPTVVVGPGGQNLKKMLSAIKKGNSFVNYIQSSIYSKRKLNLVSVKDVVRALIHLSKPLSFNTGVYICSADDDPNNSYNKIAEIMRQILKKKKLIKPIPLPKIILKIILKASRSGSGRFAYREYSSEKLVLTGFQGRESIAKAVREFVLWEIKSSAIGAL